MTKKTIKKSELKADIDAGMKREELAKKYTDGNQSELKRLLKQADLTIRKFRNPTFILQDDLQEGCDSQSSEKLETNLVESEF